MTSPDSQLRAFEEAHRDLATSAIVDGLGVSHFAVIRPVDLSRLRQLHERHGLLVDVSMGTASIRYGADEPTDTDRELIRPLLDDVATAVTAANAASTGYDLVELVRDRVEGARVAIRRAGWVRNKEALLGVLARDWLSLSEQVLALRRVQIGETEVTVDVAEVAPGRSMMKIGAESGPSLDLEAREALASMCDAHGWRSLATSESRESATLRLALHHDQQPCVLLEPPIAGGGTALLEWTYATDDANRVEALRQVLRSATVTARSELPDARAVRRLAEHQRMALARDNAAAVQRAVSEAHRDTSEALRSASDGLADITETSIKAVYGAVISAIGVVVFVGRTADVVSGLLTWLAALAVVFGLAVVVATSRQRIADHSQEIASLQNRIKNDPLTPEEDRHLALARINRFEAEKRGTSARRRTVLLAVAGAGVIMAAAVSLTLSGDSSQQSPPGGPSPSGSPTE